MSNLLLNTILLDKTLRKKGMKKKDLSDLLNVSSQTVSEWFSHRKIPSPQNLFLICKELNLSADELLETEKSYYHHFKLPNKTKQRPNHDLQARDMAECLESLILFALEDFPATPRRLNRPEVDENYIIKTSENIHNQIDSKSKKLSFESIINYIIKATNTTIIPVLWGSKKPFSIGLQISFENVSFLYINLNVKDCDIKFWLLHELAHLLAPELVGEMGEKFANKLAASVLFDYEESGTFYNSIKDLDKSYQLEYLIEKSKSLEIHPYTIFLQLKDFQEYNKFENRIHFEGSDIFKFPKDDGGILIEDQNILDFTIYKLIASKYFKSNIFVYLKKIIYENKKIGPLFIKRLLHIGFNDATEIFNSLKYD